MQGGIPCKRSHPLTITPTSCKIKLMSVRVYFAMRERISTKYFYLPDDPLLLRLTPPMVDVYPAFEPFHLSFSVTNRLGAGFFIF